MPELRYGSLCSGYGGLDLGVQSVLGGTTAWVSDIDKGANKILAHRYANVPNLGDFTNTDWSTVEPIDVLTAGFPCQPVSNAGKRLGDLDERWLWDDVARAVRELRPVHVVLENVRGLLTAGSGRLFGRVLGSLAELGYDASWHGLRAADIGAAHGRWRVFILATDASSVGHERPWGARDGRAGSSDGDSRALGLLPTPTARDWKNVGDREKTAGRMAERGQPLGEVVVNALSPDCFCELGYECLDCARRRIAHREGTTRGTDWGQYAAAIARWEHTLGRPAPAPTMTSTKGNPQLSPAFVEWLMGLPAGWVTDVPGITRNEALKALGNGVVPQQSAVAVRFLLGAMEVAA